MLSYQHGYHAGNFADVIKHWVLTRILNHMTQKNAPLFYLETHAGRGRYDLSSAQALKTNEAEKGIALLWAKRQQLSDLFSPYITMIQTLNANNQLKYYPGSPDIALNMLRKQDRLTLCELHPTEFELLKQLPKRGKKVFFDRRDGLDSLPALLPPPERRACIFIDPAYEVKTEYDQVAQRITTAYQKFPTGIYCLWYPLLRPLRHEAMLKKLAQLDTKKTLQIEFKLSKPITSGMWGCGLWIINPSYGLADEFHHIQTELDVMK